MLSFMMLTKILAVLSVLHKIVCVSDDDHRCQDSYSTHYVSTFSYVARKHLQWADY